MDLFDIAVAKKLAGGGGGGGGGASNVVVGSFTVTGSTDSIQQVTIPYTGNGYPTHIEIFATDRATLVGQTRPVALFILDKNDKTVPPDYSGSSADAATYMCVFRYSATSSTNRFDSASSTNLTTIYSNNNPSSGGSNSVRVNSNKKISIWVSDTQVGFTPGSTFGYVIEYSE